MSLFNLANLEFLKWKVHRIFVEKKINNPYFLSIIEYWVECGAFISILPRQTGKSRLLERIRAVLEKEGEQVLLLSTRPPPRLDWVCAAVNKNDCHLLIDDFMFLPQGCLRTVLGYPWKSVTMISSLRLER